MPIYKIAGCWSWVGDIEFVATASVCRHYYVKQGGQWVCTICGQPK